MSPQGWKPLADDLESDLHVTTDYRHVLAEIVAARFPDGPEGVGLPGPRVLHAAGLHRLTA